MLRVIVVTVFVSWLAIAQSYAELSLGFERVVIDPAGPRAPWGKAVGDVDGDGKQDILIGGHQPSFPSVFQRLLRKFGLWTQDTRIKGELVWYHNSSKQKLLISNRFAIRTDIEVVDIDLDGNNDVVAVTDSGVIWFRHPGNAHLNAANDFMKPFSWAESVVDPRKFHDVEVADLDNDGDSDLIVRNQSLFEYDNGDLIHLFEQRSPNVWREFTIPCEHGEGLKVADIDGDGYSDIVVNAVWYRNPQKTVFSTAWMSVNYTYAWNWSDVHIDTGDFNGDDFVDIVLTPAEEAGQYYRISWFKGGADNNWQEYIIADDIEATHHAALAIDLDRDGIDEFVTAMMNQSKNAPSVSVYKRVLSKSHADEKKGNLWVKIVVEEKGSHNLQAVDWRGDLHVDFFGAPWQIQNYHGDYPVTLWQNTRGRK